MVHMEKKVQRKNGGCDWSVVKVWRQVRYRVSAVVENSNALRKLKQPDLEIVRELQLPNHISYARPSRLVTWIKPPSDWVKLNCDGSCRGNPSNSGGGGVVCDCRGVVKATFSSHFGQGTNNRAELKAILEGIWLCKRFWYLNVVIQSDSRIDVDWLQTGSCSLWDFWEEVWAELEGMNFMVIHQFWEANSTADFLAREGEMGKSVIYEGGHALPFLKGIIRLDRFGLLSFRK
ncbi:hypothetical protein F2P56_008684, partial [Juglans regia]